MNAFKKTLLTLLVGTGIFQNAEAQLFNNVSLTVEQINQLSTQQTKNDELFKSVFDLSETLKTLNHRIINNKEKLEKDYGLLLLVQRSINFTFQLLIDNFKADILTIYKREFRAFSSARATFNLQVKQMGEKVNGINKAQGFTPFTAEDIQRLEQSLDNRGSL